MSDLVSKKCVPCQASVPAFSPIQIEEYLKKLDPPWQCAHEEGADKIRRQFQFASFPRAMDFVNKVAAVAEQEQHHPDIHVWYNKVLVVLWTHAVKGLSENDFIMAAKISQL